jgi:hypothetical protein
MVGSRIQRFKEFKDFDGVVPLLVVPELFVEGRRRCPKFG